MAQTEQDVRKLWTELVAQSNEDADLRRRMLEEPAAVLTENGVRIPEGISLVAFEDDGRTAALPIPTKPVGTELSDQQLEAVAGGIGPSQPPDGLRGAKFGPLGFDPVVE